jgi:hypothetical protein
MPRIDGSSSPSSVTSKDSDASTESRSSDFAGRLDAAAERAAPRPSENGPAFEQVLAESQAQMNEGATLEDRLFDATQAKTLATNLEENRVGPLSGVDLPSLMAEMEVHTPGSMSMKLLRFQLRMQEESLLFSFASNKVKSNSNKDIIANFKT